jgi:NitT/TauT family transport system substrate-binding protein
MMSTDRRCVLLGLVSVLAAACVPSQTPRASIPATEAPSPAPRPLPLSIGWGVTPITASPASVVWLAADLGFYSREGLDPELLLIQGTPNLIAGMRSGQVDVGMLTAYEAILLTATASMEMRMIGGSGAAGQSNTFMVVSRTAVDSLDTLPGKTFAVSRIGSYDDTLAKQFFRARGLDPGAVQFLALGDPNIRLQALIAGQIDATLTSVSTWISIRQQSGIKILSTFDEVNAAVPTWPTGNVVTAQVDRDKAEALRRFTRAIVKASRFFATNRQAWVDAMAKRRTDMDPANLGELWDLFARGWAVNGGMNLHEYTTGADLLYSTSPDFAAVPRVGLNSWADSQFVDGALRELGVDASMDAPGRVL